jgi:hypothetical protein
VKRPNFVRKTRSIRVPITCNPCQPQATDEDNFVYFLQPSELSRYSLDVGGIVTPADTNPK